MKNAGEVAEAAFVYECALRNYTVYLPTTHHTKTDVVIDAGHGLVGVQVKKATKQKTKAHWKERWKFLIGSGLPSVSRSKADNKRLDNRPRYNLYVEGDFDVMAVYIMESNTFAFYNLRDIIGTASKSWDNIQGPHNNWCIFTEKKLAMTDK